MATLSGTRSQVYGNTQMMKDRRLIVLCNVLYKITVKVLADGKAITDNVIVAFESTHYQKRLAKGRKGALALKIDTNDSFLFSGANAQECNTVKFLLKQFEEASGQSMNFHSSVRPSQWVRDLILGIIGDRSCGVGGGRIEGFTVL
ncbi:hypothetical protein OIU84_004864 [Salix udensis]|uniref:Uncharacterized protein n=1 Tax=Salix udensis TaxID=889485 RepID=A0AAD6K4W2_9ROSI|nr:hypothetical protein OIU84_004864 [Salix udensis]